MFAVIGFCHRHHLTVSSILVSARSAQLAAYGTCVEYAYSETAADVQLSIVRQSNLTKRNRSLPGGWRHTGTLAIVVRPRASKSVRFFRNTCVRLRLTVTGCLQTQLRGAWSDRDTNDIFADCSLIFYFLDLKFSNFVCPSELHPLIWSFSKISFRKKKNIRKTSQNALAPSIFIVWSIVLKLGTRLLHIQAQNTLLQNF